MKILNLYAGIGGNRKLWGDKHEVTAVESDKDIAALYSKLYPNDLVIVDDAHSYLLKMFDAFDFIWSSPPCPTHGQYRYNVGVRAKGYKPLFPDMQLYEEIIFLQHYFSGWWIVENVKPYYKPLIPPTAILQRHLFWSNFPIDHAEYAPKGLRSMNKLADYGELGAIIAETNIRNKRQVLRNTVNDELGIHILNAVPKQEPKS